MKHQKPLAVRIFIRICVVFMAVSLIGVYVVYMFAPNQEAGESDVNENTGEVQVIAGDGVSGSAQVVDEIVPEVNPENPEESAAPIVVTEDGEMDEMDKTFEVLLENGETEIIRQGDLGDAIQIN